MLIVASQRPESANTGTPWAVPVRIRAVVPRSSIRRRRSVVSLTAVTMVVEVVDRMEGVYPSARVRGMHTVLVLVRDEWMPSSNVLEVV